MNIKYDDGYIALISVLFTATVLGMLVASNGLLGWNSQQNILRIWGRKQSLLLADSCVRLAALQIKAAIQPVSQTFTLFQNNSCSIISAEKIGSAWYVRAKSTVLGAETDLLAIISGSTFTIIKESEPP